MKIRNLKRSKEIVIELEARFLDGERLTVEQIIKEKFNEAASVLSHLESQTQVRGWLSSLKQRLTKSHGLWFGSLNERGEYGIPQTREEYKHILTRYYRLARGVLLRSAQAKEEAAKAGYLFLEERFLLAKPQED